MTSYDETVDETLLCTLLITKIFFKLRYVILKSTAYFLLQYPYFILCKVQVNSFLEDSTVKLGNKERFDKEQIGIKEPFPVINLPFTS